MVDFLLLGNINVLSYKDIAGLIIEGRIRVGYNHPSKFDNTDIGVGCSWYGSIIDPPERLVLKKRYVEGEYKKFDNYDVINIDKTKDIPYDYGGVMGVTMRFIEQWNPEQFEIIGFRKGLDGKDLKVDGEWKYIRIIIYIK